VGAIALFVHALENDAAAAFRSPRHQASFIRGKVEMTRNADPVSSSPVHRAFGEMAAFVAKATGQPSAFAIALAVVAVWAVTGPLFDYSDSWQLVINTGTTIVTFLMVFLIQHLQNRDAVAIQAKLDELIRVSRARNVFIGIDQLTEAEIDELRKKPQKRKE
jgi:low affinity Fe/Cu permease